jgi:FeS assembly SUF system regulator
MLRLSRLTDYGVVVLVQLASDDDVQTAPGIARATGIPEPTVAKVLKILAAAALVISQRGARGGYRLARKLSETTVADVIAAIDGPLTVTACVETSQDMCEARALCPMHGRWDRVNDAIQRALMDITVADLAQPAVWALPAPAAGLAAGAGE